MSANGKDLHFIFINSKVGIFFLKAAEYDTCSITLPDICKGTGVGVGLRAYTVRNICVAIYIWMDLASEIQWMSGMCLLDAMCDLKFDRDNCLLWLMYLSSKYECGCWMWSLFLNAVKFQFLNFTLFGFPYPKHCCEKWSLLYSVILLWYDEINGGFVA